MEALPLSLADPLVRLYYEEEVGQMRRLVLLTGLAGISAQDLPPTSDREWLDELLDAPLAVVRDPDSPEAQEGQAAAEALFGGPAGTAGGDA